MPLDCYTGSDGLRRIRFRCNFEGLMDVSTVGGLAVLHGMRGFSKEVDHSYRAMLLIHKRVRGRVYGETRGMKEHLTRKLEYSRDLYIRSSGRPSDSERDVLPDDLGLDAQGEGDRLRVGQLTGLGRQAASEAGCQNPTNKQAIPFGFFEAAKRNPLDVAAEQVASLVQMSLFDIDPSEDAPSEELIEIVEERLLEAIGRHEDDSQEAFEEWFTGSGNSLIKQIAQQKTKRGGKLQPKDVRLALLCLGRRAYEYVGQCVHALMRTIKNSIPDPLNDEEKRLFEHMYESQPYYGNLPLALLAERAHFLQPAILAIWNEPHNQDHVGVLHRVLAYYPDMVRKRREADRLAKQRRPGNSPASPITRAVPTEEADLREPNAVQQTRKEDGVPKEGLLDPCDCHGGSVQFFDNLHGPCSGEEDPFSQVADHIRQLKKIECDANCGRWEYRRLGDSRQSVKIDVRCGCGGVAQTLSMSADDFAQYAEEVLGWKKSPTNPEKDTGNATGDS